MTNYLFLLAATALLGQAYRLTAQTTSSQGQTLDHLFSTVIRSSDVNPVASTNTRKETPINPADLRSCCEKIDKDIQRVYFLKDRKGKMKLQVRGVYTHGGALFFWLQLNNRSSLDYAIDSVGFQITAAAPSGLFRTLPKAIPPKIVTPVYVFDSAVTVEGHSRATSIFVLPRFTLPPGRQLTIHVTERNGGRNLRIQATNWTLERARPV